MDNIEPKTKSRKGRASRRRKQKMLEISKAEEELRVTGRGASAPSVARESYAVLPSDRGQLRLPVVETRSRLGWLSKDEGLLVKQLGFVPGNAVRICCRLGNLPDKLRKRLPRESNSLDSSDPVVVQLYPLASRDEFAGGKSDGRKFKSRKHKMGESPMTDVSSSSSAAAKKNEDTAAVLEPFPTMYWLTNPLLKIWVSKLEVNGLGVELEKRLQKDTAALDRMKRAHLAYGQARLRLLTDQDQKEIQKRKWSAALEEARGVAGIRNHAAVKCLHAHLAHYLSAGLGSNDNMVGEWVVDAICEMEEYKGVSDEKEET